MGKAVIIDRVVFNGMGKVTMSSVKPLTDLEISAPSTIDAETYELGVTYTPADTSQRDIEWSIISGSEYADVSNEGILTIKAGALNNSITVEVRSTDNPIIYAQKVISVTNQTSFKVVPANICLDFPSYRIMLKNQNHDANYKERMIYQMNGTKMLKTIPENPNYPNAHNYLTNDMCLINVPQGAKNVRISGTGLYFNSRNIRVTPLLSNGTRIEEVTLASVPQTISVVNATYLYVRITVENDGDEYVKPIIEWLYE